MTATIISGKAISDAMRAELRPEIEGLAARGVVPGLSVVLIGEDPASQVYVRMKAKACDALGMKSEVITLPATATEDEVLSTVDRLNTDETVHGMLVQLPLPDQIDPDRVIMRIDPRKDVDGFHPVNIGRVVIGDRNGFPPATPAGVRQILLRSGVETRGSHTVVVGRSNIVGRPMASLLLHRGEGGDATVTVAHSRTKNLGEVTRLADILIVAMGRPEFIRGDMIRPGAVVIDVGTNRVDAPDTEKGYRLVGDVHFDEAVEVASAITPVPGGVGPMTITMLLHNTVQAARQWAS